MELNTDFRFLSYKKEQLQTNLNSATAFPELHNWHILSTTGRSLTTMGVGVCKVLYVFLNLFRL